MSGRVTDWVMLELDPFVVFGDDGTLTMEPVTADDLVPVKVSGTQFYADATWSAGCNFYFVIITDGILLLSAATDRGFFCPKRSAQFVELFLKAPRRRSALSPKGRSG